MSTLLPWWGWCLLALFSYFAFRYLAQGAPSAATDDVTSLAASVLLQAVPAALQFAVPVFCMACAIFAVIHKLPDQADTRLPIKRAHNVAARSSEHEYAPRCPSCSSAMAKRLSKGEQSSFFWGCTRYPSCRGTRPV